MVQLGNYSSSGILGELAILGFACGNPFPEQAGDGDFAFVIQVCVPHEYDGISNYQSYQRELSKLKKGQGRERE